MMLGYIFRIFFTAVIGFPCLCIYMGSTALMDEIEEWIKKDPFWAYYLLKWLIFLVASPFKAGVVLIS